MREIRPEERALEEKKWLDVPEIAKELGFAEGTVRGWIREGKLRAARFGRDYRIRREDYDEFIRLHLPDGERETGQENDPQ